MGILWEEQSVGVFLLVTVVLGGGAAYLAGRAIALTWRPMRAVIAYMAILTAAVRFFHYSLFGGSFFFYFDNGTLYPGVGFYYYVIDFIILLAFATLGYRVTRAGQMATQYPWLYARSGPLSWRQRPESGSSKT